jgi:Ham1 family protein
MKTVTFITGNQHKADALARVLGLPLAHRAVDITEIQSTSLEEIVEHKVHQAYIVAKCPVLVEDVALEFMALGGLPGPFIKFFVEAPNGLENLCRMLDGFDDRSAVAACVFGYYDGQRIKLFRAELGGVIAKHPAGNGGFGWDKIFCPDGYEGKTRAELTPDEDAGTFKPIAAVRQFLTTLE